MTHLAPPLRDLTLVLVTAATVILLFRKLRLPLVLGYLTAGILVGPSVGVFPTVVETKSLEVWAEIGVLFLLFSVGLEFSYKKLLSIGGRSFLTGLVESGLVFILSLGLSQALGWSWTEGLFLAASLCISSTSIVVRSFADLNMKGRSFVPSVYGILIVEDLIAVLLLVGLSTLGSGEGNMGWSLAQTVLHLGFFLILFFVVGLFFVPWLLQKVRVLLTDETLLILSVGLCLLMVFAVTEAGFSSALGAFMMGSILAGTSDAHRIEGLLVPLRDLFAAIFFVSIGMLIDPQALGNHFGLVVGLSVFLIFAQIMSVSLGSILAGQNMRSALLAGLSLSQIGEFLFLQGFFFR
jgi:CPA2 family monovalent cation:H+ antiporter-2